MTKDQTELEKHFINSTKQSTVVFISKLIGYSLSFAINFMLAHYYGSEILGQYTLIRSYLQIIIIFTIFGFDNGLIKYVAKYNNEKNQMYLYDIIKVSLIYTFIFSLAGAILTFLFRKNISMIFNDELLAFSLIVGSWIVIPKSLNMVLGGIYKGFKKINYYIIGDQLYRKIIFILLLLLFMSLKAINLINVIIALLISNLLITIYLFKKSKKVNNNMINFFDIFKIKNINQKVKKQLISYSGTMIFISFTNTLLNYVDKIMIGIFTTSSLVGIYNIASLMGGLVTFLHSSSNVVFAPIISELYNKENIKMLNSLYSAITRLTVMFTIPIFVTLLVFPDDLLNIFGSIYIKSQTALVLIAIGQMINTSVGANGYILNMSGYEKFTLINNIIMAFLNIILNVLLIPRFGILGAAIATSLSIALVNIIKVIQVKKYLNVFPYNKKFIIVIINFLLNLFIAFTLNFYFENLMIAIITTCINYLISLFLMYLFKDEFDLIILNKLKGKIF